MKNTVAGRKINRYMIGTWGWGTGTNGANIVFGKNYPECQLRETFDAAFSKGFDLWDTAEVYGNGTSERLLGNIIKNKDVMISTKHFPGRRYSSGENRIALKNSLERLGRDKADIYWLHSPVNLEENMKELAGLYKEGLIGMIGLSNGNTEQIRLSEVILKENGASLGAVQNHYSLLAMEREAPALEYCLSHNILFFGYMLLEQGALSGHYDANNHFPLLSVRGMSFGKSKFAKIQPLIDYIRSLGAKYSIDPSQIPIAWAVSKRVIPIIGLTKPSHAEALAKGTEITLRPHEIKQLETLALESGVKCKGFWE